MLDVKLLREKPDFVRENLKRRGDKEKIKWVDEFLDLDKRYREALKRLDDLRHKKNVVTASIAELKKKGGDTNPELDEMKGVSGSIYGLETEVRTLGDRIHHILLRLPNVLHESVPIGKDDSENVEIKKIGKPPKFKFQAKNHFDVLLGLNLIDQERANKVSGHGFFYLKGDLVLLDLALMRYAIDFLGRDFTLIEPPFMLTRKPYEGVTEIEAFKDVLYKIDGEDLHMIATSEHPIAAMFMDETLLQEKLPIKLMGVSPCFRKEVGAHGKYTKGLFRMHHFNKIEQFVFCHPDQSWEIHEELQKNVESFFKSLEIPINVVNVCTGDIGSMAAKKYDTNAWMADGIYREVVSNSNCTDYQARRLNVKFREKEGAPPAGFVHTLNSTLVATSRAMVSLIENNQQEDGTVKIPKVLHPYMSGVKELTVNLK
ncbi:MAG: serine--tRNA ligase [Candidatus Aenigmarchaeota archaeon]|nr:serine--tRNA ligase [Candidatus Aenigmarchaeota archaeon]